MKNEQFKTGDVVCLKSNPHVAMTVRTTSDTFNLNIQVNWMDINNHVQTEWFFDSQLKLRTPPV